MKISILNVMKKSIPLFLLIPVLLYSQANEIGTPAITSPKYQKKIITVGGDKADIRGFTNESIQLAINGLPSEGGTVKLNSGLFLISAPVKVPSNCNLIGSGPETILKRIDGFRSVLKEDADYGELKLSVEVLSGFAPGMSVHISDDFNSGCIDVTTSVITDICDSVIYIDTHLIRDYSTANNGIVSNAGSCISLLDVENVHLSDFKIDGTKATNDWLDGCFAGAVCMIKVSNIIVENVHVDDFNGDGITWQITENVTVRNCEINGCFNGLHPGTGSVNSLIEGNISHHNDGDGLYVCYRVQHGLVKNNQLHHNKENGLSTGHRDSDMTFESNHIFENETNGVLFRDENKSNSPHRNFFIHNLVENNGDEKGGYGFAIYGLAQDLVLKDNTIRNTETGNQIGAVFINKNTPPVSMENNVMSGHKNGDVVFGK
jgi:hypothetical protein